MKKLWTFLLAGVVFTGCQQQAKEEQSLDVEEEVIVETAKNTPVAQLGVAFPVDNVFPVGELSGKLGEQDSLEDLTVSGKVSEVCQMKGCWMTLENGEGEEIRVTFKDYDSVVMPKDAGGKEVVMHGKVKRKTVSVEDLKHFAKDAGASEEEIAKITEPKETVAFVADGVVIK